MPEVKHGATYYTVSELAEKLEVHRNNVLYWISTKQITAVRIGLARKSPYLIHEDEVKRVMEKLPEVEMDATN